MFMCVACELNLWLFFAREFADGLPLSPEIAAADTNIDIAANGHMHDDAIQVGAILCGEHGARLNDTVCMCI
jgi:hypothetical protein